MVTACKVLLWYYRIHIASTNEIHFIASICRFEAVEFDPSDIPYPGPETIPLPIDNAADTAADGDDDWVDCGDDDDDDDDDNSTMDLVKQNATAAKPETGKVYLHVSFT